MKKRKKFGRFKKIVLFFVVFSILLAVAANISQNSKKRNNSTLECYHLSTEIVTFEADPTCCSTGSIKTKNVCKDCGLTLSIDSTTIPKLPHSGLTEDGYGICEYGCGYKRGYFKTDSSSTLVAGDKIVIVADSEPVALSTVQNTNNRGQVNVEKVDDMILFDSDEVQIITLERSAANLSTFAFNVGNGYLYTSTGESTHYLKTQSDNTPGGGVWKISIDESGVATILGNNGSTHQQLMYNSTSDLFSTYEGTQKHVCIYVFVEYDPSVS